MRDKSSLLDVRRLYKNLMIRYRDIETAEDRGASERVENFIEAWQLKAIEFRHGIQTPIVHAHPPAAVFLSINHDWRFPRRCKRACNVRRHKLIDLELDSGAHFNVRQAADGLTKGTQIAGIYFVERLVCSADI